MKWFKKIGFSVGIFFFLMSTTIPAHAYLDPGSGSMIIQGIIAAIAAVSVSIGVFRRRIGLFMDRIFGRKKSGENEEKGEKPDSDEK